MNKIQMKKFQTQHGSREWTFGGGRSLFPLKGQMRIILAVLLMVLLYEGAWGDEQTGTKAVRRSHPLEQSQPAPLGRGDLYVLAVGISDYANVPKLNLSAKDAKDFADFIETQRKVFKNTHVKLLLDGQATKVEVEKYLYGDLRRAGKDDSIILFFSGHGGSDPGEPGSFYFLTHDSDPKFLTATAVNMAGLKFFDRLDCNRVLLIADACHAGGFSKILTKSIDPPLEKFMEMFKDASGRVILSSSRPNEYSLERPNLSNSVFTYYLLKGLKGEADIQRNGVITLQEIYDYVYDRTKEETEGVQHPQMEGAVAGRFPISVLGQLDGTLNLNVWFVAQDPRCSNPDCINPPEGATECKDPQCGDVTITNGSDLHSGQNYQIGFRPQTTSYVYVYQIDTQGNIARLFPGNEYLDPKNSMQNPLKGEQIYWIPGKDAWLKLDENEGKEKIYVVASRSRNALLEDFGKEAEAGGQKEGEDRTSGAASNKTQETLEKVMGVSKAIVRKLGTTGSNRNAPAKVRSFEELSHAIESAKLDVAESVWFWHKGLQIGR